MYKIKNKNSLIKRDCITLATKHATITTIFKYVPSNNSHITLYTHRNPYSTPGTNTSVIGSARTRSRKKAHLHIQVNFTYIKFGGHVSDNLCGGMSVKRKTAWLQNFPHVKLDWAE